MLLVILEHENGELVEAAKEALTFGRVLAEKMDDDLEAALIGSDDDDLVEAAGEYGADTVHTCTHDLLSDYGPDAWGSVIAQMVEELEPELTETLDAPAGPEGEARAPRRLELRIAAEAGEGEELVGAGARERLPPGQLDSALVTRPREAPGQPEADAGDESQPGAHQLRRR